MISNLHWYPGDFRLATLCYTYKDAVNSKHDILRAVDQLVPLEHFLQLSVCSAVAKTFSVDIFYHILQLIYHILSSFHPETCFFS